MCVFLLWYSYDFTRLHNLRPWFCNSLIWSHNLWVEFCTNAIHNALFLFHQVPITAGWTRVVWCERFTSWHIYTCLVGLTQNTGQWLAFRTSTYQWAQCYWTSVIWRELITTKPCATAKKQYKYKLEPTDWKRSLLWSKQQPSLFFCKLNSE